MPNAAHARPTSRRASTVECRAGGVCPRHGLNSGTWTAPTANKFCRRSCASTVPGTFTSLDRLDSLMAVAYQDVNLSAGADEDLFRRMGATWRAVTSIPDAAVVRYDNVTARMST